MFVLMDEPVNELYKMPQNGIHLVHFNSSKDFIEKVRNYVVSDEKRNEIARNGMRLFYEYHEPEVQAKRIFDEMLVN